MARFDVYRVASRDAPLVVDVQATLLRDLSSRVVVPLASESVVKGEPYRRLKPMIEVGGKRFVFVTTDISAIPVGRLGAFVTNVEDPYRNEIIAALDFLFQGF